MHYKHIVPILLAAALIVAGLWYATTHTAIPQAPATVATTSTATTTHSTAKIAAPASVPANIITIPVTVNETVLAAMQAYARGGQFTYTGENYSSLGFFVESINGKKNADGFYWFLYINGRSSETGASMAQVHPGDAVQWRYQKGD